VSSVLSWVPYYSVLTWKLQGKEESGAGAASWQVPARARVWGQMELSCAERAGRHVCVVVLSLALQ
jgi:hypothetical protein